MKKMLIALGFTLFAAVLPKAQMTGKLIQGTLKPSSGVTNSAIAVIRSSATYTGQFSNVQFTFQIPVSVTPQPTVEIKTNFLANYIPTSGYVTQVLTENGFYNYLFAAVPTASPVFNFVSGMEVNALEIQVNGPQGQTIPIRLASLANGGSSGQLNFYIEVSGNDNTNFSSMFYGTGAVNGGSYSTNSYVPLANSLLPLKLIDFTIMKDRDNAVLNWSVENQSSGNSYFEIERSTNGSVFTKIGIVRTLDNGRITNSYGYIDPKLSAVINRGIIYCRLKQVDQDGKFVYSSIGKVDVASSDFAFSILDNPVESGKARMIIQSQKSGTGSLRIIDIGGRIVHKSRLTWAEGSSEHTIPLINLPSGSYVANLITTHQQYFVKFVK